MRFRGLRVRLLLALFATSAVTLLVAALALLSPLQDRLREQSQSALQAAVFSAREQLEAALRAGNGDETSIANGVRDRTNAQSAQIYRYTRRGTLDGAPNAIGGDTAAVVRAFADPRSIVARNGDGITLTVPLRVRVRDGVRTPEAVLQVRKTDTDVSRSFDEVRRAFLTAALIGLALALVLGLVLATTLSRRLGRLRLTAQRIVEHGEGAPVPVDATRDEIGDLARAMAAMQHALRRQEQARRRFVATASHELRTPLTSLGGMLELLGDDLAQDDLDREDARAQVELASAQVTRLQTLAAELLDLSRLDAGIELRSEPVELSELARAVAAEFGRETRESEHALDVEMPPGPCWGRGDPSEVARIARILIDNAVRYAPSGAHIVVTPAYSGEHATITVADDGPGIPEDERDAIFERFRRGRASSSNVTSGFGLGLAIGRELAERQSGSLTYDARPGEPGARFVLRLPIELPAGGSAQAQSAAAQDDDAAAGTFSGLM